MDQQTEMAKLSATLLNGLAVAILAATVIVPAAQWLGSIGVLVAASIGVLMVVALHLGARRLLATHAGSVAAVASRPSLLWPKKSLVRSELGRVVI